MFDVSRTIQLITGALFERETTWRNYLIEASDWKKTAFLLTGPLIVISAIGAYVMSLIFADSTMFSIFRPTLLTTAFGIVMGAIVVGIIAFIFSALAGALGGKNSFALGLAAISLAFAPGYAGQILAGVPWIGGLNAIGLGIFSLVQLWKIIPIYLEVPDGKRTAHYIVSLVATIVVLLIIGRVINPLLYGSGADSPFGSISGTSSLGQGPGSIVSGNIQRAILMDEAMKDIYSPPSDGRLTEKQVRTYVSVMLQVRKDQQETAARLQEFAAKADQSDEMSIKDLGSIVKGANDIGRLATSDMEVVKNAGDNWAEHKWVAQTLLIASRQKEGNDALAHNFALYQKYAEQLGVTNR